MKLTMNGIEIKIKDNKIKTINGYKPFKYFVTHTIVRHIVVGDRLLVVDRDIDDNIEYCNSPDEYEAGVICDETLSRAVAASNQGLLTKKQKKRFFENFLIEV